MPRLECRRQMHYAEHLARVAARRPLSGPIDFLIAKPLAAYLSPHCEASIAMRLSAAITLIEGAA